MYMAPINSDSGPRAGFPRIFSSRQPLDRVEPGAAAVKYIAGFVHLAGAIAATGTNQMPFTLPVGYRPPANVYLPVDVCNANKGRLFIQPNGTVIVSDAGGGFVNARCFTSLEGASFATQAVVLADLPLRSGWIHAPFGTSRARSGVVSGLVRFAGATASKPDPDTLVPFDLVGWEMKSIAGGFAPVDLCDGAFGRLELNDLHGTNVRGQSPDENGTCFTSLEGLTF